MTNSCEPVSTFNNYFELCNFKSVRRKQHNYFDYNIGKVKISLSKIISSGSISIKSQGSTLMSSLWAYVSRLKNSSINAIKVFKTNVTRSQRSGKDNTKIEYC